MDATSGTLEDDVGPEIYQELLGAFVDDLSLQLAELARAAADGDVPGARAVAHQLNGTAPSFGATHLNELASRVLQLDQDQGALVAPLVEQITGEVGRFRAASLAR